VSLVSDPYDEEVDEAIPLQWPIALREQNGQLVDIVKKTFTTFDHLRTSTPSLIARDYEITGVMLRLNLLRPSLMGGEEQSFLSQVSYVSTFPKDAKNVHSLFTAPTVSDINLLLFKKKQRFYEILSHVDVQEITTNYSWSLPIDLIPEKGKFKGYRTAAAIVLSANGNEVYTKDRLKELKLPIRVQEKVVMKASIENESLLSAIKLEEVKLKVSANLQGNHLSGNLYFKDVELNKASAKAAFDSIPQITPLWAYTINNEAFLPSENSVIIPKNFRDNGVSIGDVGVFSFGSFGATSVQEQTLNIEVAGFYDPGLMVVGARPIFADNGIVQTISSSSSSIPLDPLLCNGIQIWFDDLSETNKIASTLQKKLEEEGVAPYWEIKTFYDYDFAKDLLLQFKSDRYLFTLIGIVILVVACTNIISLLLLLVHTKKKEIAILQVLGATKYQIAAIFGASGALLGIISSAIGTILGLITLNNLDALVKFLSFIQGQEAFNSAFYGSSLPNTVSQQAILLILIATPILSLVAGLIPATKACKFPPAQTLRTE